MPNGKFLKAIPIPKFEEKGQLFPQNENISGKNAAKIKIKKIESNEISESLQTPLEFNLKQN